MGGDERETRQMRALRRLERELRVEKIERNVEEAALKAEVRYLRERESLVVADLRRAKMEVGIIRLQLAKEKARVRA
jgi:hypothetical protein